MWDKMMDVMDNWYFIGGMLCALVVLLALGLLGLIIAMTKLSSSGRRER
jgi:hypothetical protein